MYQELDAKVDENVMGRKPLSKMQLALGFKRIYTKYSSNIEMAFQVVEKMRSDGWQFNITSMGLFTDVVFFRDTVLTDDEGDEQKTVRAYHRHWARTIPEAICLAALKAVGAEPSGQRVEPQEWRSVDGIGEFPVSRKDGARGKPEDQG